MNKQQRHRKAELGIIFLAEAISDVLENHVNVGSGVTAEEVGKELGLKIDDNSASQLCRGVLREMQHRGEVVPTASDGGRWRLADG